MANVKIYSKTTGKEYNVGVYSINGAKTVIYHSDLARIAEDEGIAVYFKAHLAGKDANKSFGAVVSTATFGGNMVDGKAGYSSKKSGYEKLENPILSAILDSEDNAVRAILNFDWDSITVVDEEKPIAANTEATTAVIVEDVSTPVKTTPVEVAPVDITPVDTVPVDMDMSDIIEEADAVVVAEDVCDISEETVTAGTNVDNEELKELAKMPLNFGKAKAHPGITMAEAYVHEELASWFNYLCDTKKADGTFMYTGDTVENMRKYRELLTTGG